MQKVKNFIMKFINNDFFRLVRGEFYKFFKSASFIVLSVMLIVVIVLTAVIYQRENNALSSIFGADDGTDSLYYSLKTRSIEDIAVSLNIDINSTYFDRLEKEFSDINKRIIFTVNPSVYFESINPIISYFSEENSELERIFGGDLTNFIKTNVRFYRLLGESLRSESLKKLLQDSTIEEIVEKLSEAPLFARDKLIYSVRVGQESLADKIIECSEDILRLYKRLYSESTQKEIEDLAFYVNGVYSIHNSIYNRIKSDFSSSMISLIADYTILYEIEKLGYEASVIDTLKLTLKRSELSFVALNDRLNAINSDEFAKLDEQQKKAKIDELVLDFKYFMLIFQTYDGMLDVGINEIGFMYFNSGTFTTPKEYKDYNSQASFVRSNVNKTASILDSEGYNSDYKLEALRDFMYELTEREEGLYSLSLDTEKSQEDKYWLIYDVFPFSYTANLDEKEFVDRFAPIMAKSEDFLQKIVYCYKEEKDNKLFDRFFGYLSLDYSQFKDKVCNNFAEFIDIAQELSTQTPMISEYIRGMYLSIVIAENRMSDSDLGNVYGMINIMGYGVSKYKLRSDIAKLLYQFENSDSITETGTATGLDNGYGYMSFAINIVYLFVVVAGIVIAAGQIAGEHTAGSIKLLLIRPYRRYKILLSKIIMTNLTIFAMMLVSFILLFLIGGIGFGFSSRPALVIFNATRIMILSPFVITLLRFIAMFFEATIYALIAIMISTVFRSRSAAVAISMVVYFGAAILGLLLSGNDWYRFILFNNTNLFVYFAEGPSLNDMTIWFSLLINAIYIAVISFATFFIFEKKDG